MKLDTKLTKFLSTYNGEEITPKVFCDKIKIAMGTFYNNRDKIEAAGVNFVHGSKGVSTRSQVKVTDSNLNQVRFSLSLYRQLINQLNLEASIQVPYTGVGDKLFILEGHISPKEAVEFLTKNINKEELTQEDRMNGTKLLVDLRFHSNIKISSAILEGIEESFKELYNITPEREQIEVVYMMYRALTKGKSQISFVQALAGTSKTTCVNVLKHFMKDVNVVSYTQMASSELESGSTLHSLLKKHLKLDVVNTPEDEILLAASMKAYLEDTKPIKRLVIDECTTITQNMLQSAMHLADKIVFVGDKNQFKNNSAFLGPRIGSLSKQYRFLNSESSLQVDITQAMLRKDTKEIKRLLDSATIGTFEAKVRTRRTTSGTENYTDYSNSFSGVLDILKGYTDLKSIVVAYSKDACTHINNLLNGGKDITRGSKVTLTRTQYKPYPLPSGSFGTVLSVSGDTCKVMFSGGLYEVAKDEISLGYAVTSLKAQGSAWDNVLFIEGTAPRQAKMEDSYVCPTRAKVTLKVLSRGTVDTKELAVQSIHSMEEGNRNASVYSTLEGVKEVAINSGLPLEEVNQIASSAFKVTPKSKVSTRSEVSPKQYSNWGYQLDGSHPNALQMNKTEEEARYLLNVQLKAGSTGFLTRNLEGTNIVVIDCDRKEAVEAFKQYQDKTHVYLSEDGTKAHYEFITDEVFTTKHYAAKGLDFLGNAKYTRQNIKPNKVSNGLTPMKLTKEVLDCLARYVS